MSSAGARAVVACVSAEGVSAVRGSLRVLTTGGHIRSYVRIERVDIV